MCIIRNSRGSLNKSKSLISRITLFFGFLPQRVLPLRRIKINKIKSPIYIEFIGASSVGKTTLYRQLYNVLGKCCLDIKQFVGLNSVDGHIEKYISDDSFYQILANERIEMVKNIYANHSPYNKLNAFRTATNIINEDAIVHFYNKNNIILSEEGLFQFFSNGFELLYHYDKDKFTELIKNRGYVFCYASPKVIAERVHLRRNKTGHIWFGHKVSNDDELLSVIKSNLEEKERLKNILKKYVPILEINTESSLLVNQQKIVDFINKFNK